MSTQSLQKLDDRLKSMLGKTFLNNATAHKILSYKLENDRLTLISDRKWFPAIDVQHADRFLANFLETEPDDTALPATLVKPVVLQGAADLKQIMLDNIKRVQESREYIPQAAEVRDQIQTLINLAKVEIEYTRQYRKS